MMIKLQIFVVMLAVFQLNCSNTRTVVPESADQPPSDTTAAIKVGAERLNAYLPLIKGKKVALMVNQTSVIHHTHLVDTLLQLGVSVQKIFAPEHGFRGTADAGEKLEDGKDSKTGLPVISLYGKKKKPSTEDLAEIELVIFDIQDVGARFYTYISSMHYLMEACAEHNLPLLILDRPNPNGHYVDGPVLQSGFESFVGLHPVPVVHGMTVGEYAQMINGEGWLKNSVQCSLEVIICENYDHQTFYELPIKPSPNLPNIRSIYLYPSLCFLEGTNVSVGRGTRKQFQLYGHPAFRQMGEQMPYRFIPEPMPGAKYPKLEGKTCYGEDLSALPIPILRKQKKLDLGYLLKAYQAFPERENFFLENLFFDKLAGTDQLRIAILAGKDEAAIRQSWKEDLLAFESLRQPYLLYPVHND